MMYSRADFEAAAAVIRQRTPITPKVGMVLGSGLNKLADEITNPVVIPYAEIPGCPQSTVPGHAGRLVIGHLEGVPVAAQQGRTHLYEGYTPEQITFLIRVFKLLGVEMVFLTNAAGGLNPTYKAGDVMLMNDHINMPGMTGQNPLIGSFADTSEPLRFISMVNPYDRELRQLAHTAAKAAGVDLKEGVYVCLTGPNFETPAEVRFLRGIGGDAVGMSTIHEVLVARHAGMRVMALSSVTNAGIDSIDTEADINHLEVLDMAAVIVPRVSAILRGVLRSLR
ncbi:MAG: purine-nucleoside phosphorylase [Anaerolineae bacterium]